MESQEEWYACGLKLKLSNFIDCEKKLTSTHLFMSSLGIIVLFTEYLKEVEAATFEIHSWSNVYYSNSASLLAERRLKEIIMSYTDKDLSSIAEMPSLDIPTLDMFICPMCHAQYTFRSLRISEDGLTNAKLRQVCTYNQTRITVGRRYNSRR